MEQQSTTPLEAEHNAHPGAPQAPQKKNKKKLIIVAVVAVLLVLGIGGIAATKLFKKEPSAYDASKLTNDQEKLLSQSNAFAQQYLQNCKADKKVSFTHSPVSIDQMGYLEPMGKTSDGHVTPTDHVYIAPKSQSAADNTTDVVMPADGTVSLIGAMPAQYIGDRNQQTAPEDHRLVVTHNCQYVSIFIHIHQLSDSLKTALGGSLKPNEQKQISIDLKAGDKLGKIGGNPVDWSLMDATKKLSGLTTPDLYKGEPWKVHVIDPVSVYSGSLKDQLVTKSLRVAAPYGGKIDFDKKGALIGNWFREGTNGYMGSDQQRYWDGHLSVVPNYIDDSATTVSLGNWEGKAAQFTAKSGMPNPASVTKASGITKYEIVDVQNVNSSGQPLSGQMAKGMKLVQTGQIKGTILLQVLGGEKLKVEQFPGKTASQVSGFTSAAQTYVR